MYRRSPPLFLFLSYLYGTLKPFIWNWAVGKESSSFVSDIRSKLVLLFIMYLSAWNLFLAELILRWPNINLLGHLLSPPSMLYCLWVLGFCITADGFMRLLIKDLLCLDGKSSIVVSFFIQWFAVTNSKLYGFWFLVIILLYFLLSGKFLMNLL